MSKVIWITGAEGFTGQHLSQKLEQQGYRIYAPNIDLTEPDSLIRASEAQAVQGVIHLAAQSYVGHKDASEFYRVNTIGTENLLQALKTTGQQPQKIILASSANIYGTPNNIKQIPETQCPEPMNHYAASKLAMEHMAKNWFDTFPILMTRPFNYTGLGQDTRFVIPKIIAHYRQKHTQIELGNLKVARDFSSVTDIIECYSRLLNSDAYSETVNLCSGQASDLETILDWVSELAGYRIEVRVNPAFVRPNEIPSLCGDASKLEALIQFKPKPQLKTVLQEMLSAPEC